MWIDVNFYYEEEKTKDEWETVTHSGIEFNSKGLVFWIEKYCEQVQYTMWSYWYNDIVFYQSDIPLLTKSLPPFVNDWYDIEYDIEEHTELTVLLLEQFFTEWDLGEELFKKFKANPKSFRVRTSFF